MPSRTPFAFTSSSSSSTSSSTSSSFTPFPNLNPHSRDHLGLGFSSNSNTNINNPISEGGSADGDLGDLAGLNGLESIGRGGHGNNSLGSSLSSSRDEHDPISYTPIYPSYSSSFSNSSLELHESLLLAIRERQQQQLLQFQQQQQQQQLLSQQYNAVRGAASTAASMVDNSSINYIPQEHPLERPEMQTEQTEDPVLFRQQTEELTTMPSRAAAVTIPPPTAGAGTVETVEDIRRQSQESARIASAISFADDTTSHHASAAHVSNLPPSLPPPPPPLSSLPMTTSADQDASVTSSYLPFHTRQFDQGQGQNHQAGPDGPRPLSLSSLLLAQPLVIDDDLTERPMDPPEVRFTPLRLPRPPSPLDLNHLQGDEGYTHNSSNGVTPSNDRREGDDGAEDRLDTSTHPYHPPPFSAMSSQDGAFATDTHLALSQVLTSFQDAIVDSSYDRSPSIAQDIVAQTMASTLDINIPSAPSSLDSLEPIQNPTFNHHRTLSAQLPITSDMSSGQVISDGDLVSMPRETLPRRRYATRDYSSGSVSSDDWLNHPDVVAFSNPEGASQEVAIQHAEYRTGEEGQETVLDNQENIPPPHRHAFGSQTTVENTPVNSSNNGFTLITPTTIPAADTSNASIPSRARVESLEHQHPVMPAGDQEPQVENELRRMMETLTMDSLPSTTAAGSFVSSAISEATSNQDVGEPPLNTQTSEEPTTAAVQESELTDDSSRSDRLGLLGPLLSSAPTTLSSSSEDVFEFSRLSSMRPGFDSSILSMASRIRQARLARLLRLMSERDTPVGYPERYPWGQVRPIDTRSMVNHVSGSRGTSRAGSLEDGLVDPSRETESVDGTDDGRAFVRNRETMATATASTTTIVSQFYPLHHPTFAEILDCNGNPIECSSDSYASSSASSITSHETIDERDEDMDWTDAIERRRRRRMQIERSRWNRGIIRGHGRSRVVSTGTVFEGVEHVSEADSLLIENFRYHSLKASWATNPNGESWSDDEGDDPQRGRHGANVEDKDQETVFMRRGQPTLGVLQPSLVHSQGSSQQAGGLYYIYGNVRNRYGPESARRRRVMSEMTDLLRREQEWERELEHYNREMAAFRAGNLLSAIPLQEERGESATNQTGNGEPMSFSSAQADIPVDNSDSLVSEGFQEYEQGHSQYHFLGEMVGGRSSRQQQQQQVNDGLGQQTRRTHSPQRFVRNVDFDLYHLPIFHFNDLCTRPILVPINRLASVISGFVVIFISLCKHNGSSESSPFSTTYPTAASASPSKPSAL
ncbi:hypothetical protein BGZ50_000605 [Haplosporangium sp. Z 11]|nr:hypothetical protein BGZ50_000605 [Haplosporangium sp. Z 11]